MSSEPNQVIEVKILERGYKIKCPSEQTQELQEAARYIDSKMRELRKASAAPGTDHIAVVTALNVAHELMLIKQQKHSYIDTMNQRIQDLQKKISQALLHDDPLEA